MKGQSGPGVHDPCSINRHNAHYYLITITVKNVQEVKLTIHSLILVYKYKHRKYQM